MKKITCFVMALALVLGLSQCKKEQPLEPTNEGNGVRITLDVENGGNNGSRANVNPPHVTFENGDQILVASGGHYVGALTRENDVFSGGIDGDKVVSGEPLYFYFLGNNAVLGTADGDGNINGCTVDISDQRNYPHLPVISMGVSKQTYPSEGNLYSSKLYNKASLMKFNVVTASDAATCITGMNNKVTVYFGLDKVAEEGTGLGDDATNHGFKYEKDGAGIIKMKGAYGSVQTPAVKWAIVLPQTALGAGEAGSAYSEDGKYSSTRPAMAAIPCNQYLDDGVDLTVGRLIDLSGLDGDYTLADGDVVTGTLAGNYQISITSGATVTLNGVTINGENEYEYEWAGITCVGDATIILSGENTVKGFLDEYPGIFVPENSSLIINGTGSLDASSNGWASGIGAGYDFDCGNIEIRGGIITATGGEGAAGIGSGPNDSFGSTCGTITISGGTVTANGGDDAAGIGCGSFGTCGDISISGGTIFATGAGDGAGIGCDASGICGNISITGGIITATGSGIGAGIGTVISSECGTITIANTVTSVTATKGLNAANSIGKGTTGAGTCVAVKFGGQTMYDGSSWTTTPTNGGTYGGLSLAITTTGFTNDTWTLTPYVAPSVPEGAINGLFSVSATQQVWFSQGNLQATTTDNGGTWTWSFATNQYDTIGNAVANTAVNGNGTVSTNGTVDLFG